MYPKAMAFSVHPKMFQVSWAYAKQRCKLVHTNVADSAFGPTTWRCQVVQEVLALKMVTGSVRWGNSNQDQLSIGRYCPTWGGPPPGCRTGPFFEDVFFLLQTQQSQALNLKWRTLLLYKIPIEPIGGDAFPPDIPW